MYQLVRLSLQNWYLCSAADIEFQGSIGLIGETGAGKTSLLDALQLVMCGGSHRSVHLNVSSEVRSERAIIEYCLGYLVPKKDGGEPLRTSCETIVALTFEEKGADGSRRYLSAGIVMTARLGDSREVPLTRFIAPGYAYSAQDWRIEEADGTFLRGWDEIIREIKKHCPGLREYRSNIERFVADLLAEARRGARQPDVHHFLKSFSNALAFKPINDPTAFVREFILERDDLNVENVRNRVRTWKGFVEAARLVEEKLERLKGVKRSFEGWGRGVLDRIDHTWRLACAGVERARLEYALAREGLQQADRDYREMSEVKEALEHQLALGEGALQSLELQLRESGAEGQAARITTERQLLAANLRNLEKEVQGLRDAFRMAANIIAVRDWLPGSFVPAVAAAEAALSIMGPGFSWVPKVSELRAMQSKVKGLALLPERLKAPIEALDDDLAALRAERATLEENARRLGKGASPLSPHTQALMGLLGRAGIAAEPLCDVTEIVDETWQFAAEAVLGLGREALIVDPRDVRRANEILYANRNSHDLHHCRLVKTSRTHEIDVRAKRGTLLHAVRSENGHALAYLATHLGGIAVAETEDELERARRAIMRNGKATSNLDYRVHRDQNFALILGRQAREASRERVEARSAAVRADIEKKQRMRGQLEQANRAAFEAAAHDVDIEKLAFAYEDLERTRRDIDRRLAAGLTKDQRALMEAIEQQKSDLGEYRTEIGNQEKLVIDAARLQGERKKEAGAAEDKLRGAVRAKRTAAKEFDAEVVGVLRTLVEAERLGRTNPYLGERLQFRDRARAGAAHFKRREEEGGEALKPLAPERIEAIAGRAKNALLTYCSSYQIDPPYSDDAPTHYSFVWVVRAYEKLEKNELREHLERAATAEREMVFTIHEDLLNKLTDKFKNLDRQIRALNEHLRKHRFTNQIYKFGKKTDPASRKIRKLAMAVGDRPEEAQAIIEKRHEDPELRDAMDDLENYIAAADGAGLEDYRRYFSFDLYMLPEDKADEDVDEDRGAVHGRMSLSGRARVGSGGEAQAPFYVAIAASMAMAYFPDGRTGDDAKGLGLVLFDEAFAKLDILNSAALISFFKTLGLQIMIAAPESARPIFTEMLETVTTISKSAATQSVYIASEFPKERARRELAEINPSHKGVEWFRARLSDAAE